VKPEDVLNFWFNEIDKKLWFEKDEKFDQRIRQKFEKTFEDILSGKMESWSHTPEGRLAEIIVLDQFSRNMFRGTAKSFSGDQLALKLAQAAVKAGDDQKISIERRAFLYMPYMHSEDHKVHEEAMRLFSQPGLEYNLKYEILHKNIIDRFGRYPHRNKILGRESTPEELEFLKKPGSSF
jgi:uncharacterized protein (DUF924 family)